MSSINESARRSFHDRQMAQLTTLVPGLDPDPPVLLCSATQPFDQFMIMELKRHGWPATGKTNEEYEANPPSPIKGAVLAKKLARGNGLSEAHIELLAKRIKWLQRNRFRWGARDGYAVLVAAEDAGAVVHQAPDKDHAATEKRLCDTHVPDAMQSDHEGHSAPDGGLSSAPSAIGSMAQNEVEASSVEEGTTPVSAAKTGGTRTAAVVQNAPIDEPKDRPKAHALSTAADNCDAALAALEGSADGDSSLTFDDYAKAIGEAASDETDDRLVSLRTGHINSVEGHKVRSLLFAINYNKPREEIERRARALAADKAQLSAAMSGPRSTSEDIRDAFAKLGLNSDA